MGRLWAAVDVIYEHLDVAPDLLELPFGWFESESNDNATAVFIIVRGVVVIIAAFCVALQID